MASSHLGIKQLLEAEQKAQEVVNKARKEKINLLKQAREEADKEIAEYRGRRQREFDDYSRKILEGQEDHVKGIQRSTGEAIEKQDKDLAVHKDEVIQMLLKYVVEVSTDAE